MQGAPVFGVTVGSLEEALSRAVRLLQNLNYSYDSHFLVAEEEHAIIKTSINNVEKWFYLMFSQSPFFAGQGGVKMIDLERLADDPRLEEVLLVREDGKVYSCAVRDLLFYTDGEESESRAISVSRLKDPREYDDWRNPGGQGVTA